MRRLLLALIGLVVVAGIAFGGWRAWSSFGGTGSSSTIETTVASASPGAVAVESPNASASPESGASPEASVASAESSVPAESPAAEESAEAGSPAPGESPAAEETSTAAPSPTPTIPAEPTGLRPGWDLQAERVEGGREADLLVRTGDINNLGYGWPAGFTPFSGKSTPPHPYPCTARPGAAPGTDRIMLGSAVTAAEEQKGDGDGYASCTTRDENMPQAISLAIGTLPPVVHVVLVQMFLDDFQAPVWKSHFQVSLGGTRIPNFEDTINTLNQTGPIGKLVTLRLLPEYVPLLRKGDVDLSIDDPTTHKLDGYAVDFVRVLVNPHAFQYAVTIACTVVDADTQKPIGGATVAAAQVTETTGADGTRTLHGVPAGLVSIDASAAGYDSNVQLLDLEAGTTGQARFELRRHKEGFSDLQRQIARNGSVALYGIHFDTASATLRPDSRASLETVLELLNASHGSRWIISGHTDNQGGAAYNLELSNARAKSVVAWLTAHGIATNRLEAQGFGMTRPVADNGTENGRALNRRVEIKPAK